MIGGDVEVDKKYSVLMSVYSKEKPEYLRQSMESIFNQTIPTEDFVLVCDGPLTKELNDVISQMSRDSLRIIRLEKNCGLGIALNVGITYCKNNIIARMDSDDISRPDRCEKELEVFANNPEIDIVSGTVEEFFDNDIKEVIGRRVLPTSYKDIVAFSRKRNPFNHPAVMFKKDAVLAAGNYSEKYHLFEDYYLWVRMLINNSKAVNITEPVLYMRISKYLYIRRGGFTYAKDMITFHRWMMSVKWTSPFDFYTGAIPHAMICILPNKIRTQIYKYLHY